MCVQQGYVPPTCKLDGQMCWLLIQEGKDPCKGCNHDRNTCNGKHAAYDNLNYVDAFINAFPLERHIKQYHREQYKRELDELKRKRVRTQKHSECNSKIIMYITYELSLSNSPIVEIKVHDIVNEKGYIKRCSGIDEALCIIPACISKYHVGQIQVETDFYGKLIYDSLCKMNIPDEVDIVPIKYIVLRV